MLPSREVWMYEQKCLSPADASGYWRGRIFVSNSSQRAFHARRARCHLGGWDFFLPSSVLMCIPKIFSDSGHSISQNLTPVVLALFFLALLIVSSLDVTKTSLSRAFIRNDQSPHLLFPGRGRSEVFQHELSHQGDGINMGLDGWTLQRRYNAQPQAD